MTNKVFKMRYNQYYKAWLVGVISATLTLASCSDEWDKHYNEDNYEIPTQSITEIIAGDASLSTFYAMLKQTGYDTIIGTSQTYTVWAPNNDALSGVDLNDAALVKSIVMNHIARFSYPTSGITDKAIYMQTGKFIHFVAGENGQYSFGGKALLDANTAAKNGILHSIGQYIPMHFNLWEYIMNTPGLDSLKNYLVAKDSRVFDPFASTIIGYDADKRPIYDSVFIDANSVLNRIGDLKTEDSIYSMIMPSNTAWIEAYGRIGKYFSMPATTQFDYVKRQREKTQFAIVQDLVFRGRVLDSYPGDSLVSTTNHVFHSPADLFAGANRSERSNGLSYVTDLLTHPAHLSWHQAIKIEAEADSGRVNTNSNIFKKNSSGTGFTLSGDKFIEVDPTSTSSLSKIAVTFPIPNTLAAKYNVYCVFAPDSLANPNTAKPGKANFYISYIGAKGQPLPNQKITVANNIISRNSVTKMFLTTFTFPFSNLVDDYSNAVTVSIKVENAVGTNETAAYTRTMRIDCIILEPAQ